MGANFTFPGGGFYHATKYAVEAISDALRFEVKGFGVHVVVDPARAHPDRTSARRRRPPSATPRPRARTASFNAIVAKATQDVYTKGAAAPRSAARPEAVAKAIERAITLEVAEDPLSRDAQRARAHRASGRS